MGAKTAIIFQPYTIGKKGALNPGQPVQCRGEDEGRRRAERAVESGSAVGAHVVRVEVDEEAGDYGEPEYLAAVGQVPETV